MKIHSILLVVKKMQIKTIMKYHFLPTKLSTLNARKEVEQQVKSRIAKGREYR